MVDAVFFGSPHHLHVQVVDCALHLATLVVEKLQDSTAVLRGGNDSGDFNDNRTACNLVLDDIALQDIDASVREVRPRCLCGPRASGRSEYGLQSTRTGHTSVSEG